MRANLDRLSLELRRAAAAGAVEKVQELLRKEVDINAKSSNGNTALHWAAKNYVVQEDRQENFAEILILLIRNGADDLLRNDEGKTVYHLLESQRHIYADKSIFYRIACLKFLITLLPENNSISKEELQRFSVYASICTRFFALLFCTLDFTEDTSPVKLLSLGCGFCLDALALIKYAKIFNRELIYVGVDNSSNQITDSISSFAKNYPDNIVLIKADATNVEQLAQEFEARKSVIGSGKFNLGLFRNPDFTDFNGRFENFNTMLSETFPAFLEDEADLLVTLGSEYELDNFFNNSSLEDGTFVANTSNHELPDDFHRVIILDSASDLLNGLQPSVLDKFGQKMNFSEKKLQLKL